MMAMQQDPNLVGSRFDSCQVYHKRSKRMVKSLNDKIAKLWLKLLKAWAQGKEKKAVKLQHKMLEAELERKIK